MSILKKSSTPVAGAMIDSRYADEKGRLYFYDNAKFILIFLVVLAHAISPFSEFGDAGDGRQFFLYLWRIINTLHMPCMIFISGFFAKKYIRPDGSINVQRPFTYMVYYMAAQITVAAFEVFVMNTSVAKSVLNPRSSLWFLVCLIWWYLLLPVVDKIEPRYMLVIAILAGLLIGYDEKVSNLMAMSRMVVHFPFFLFGYYVSGEQMQKLHTKKAKIISVPVLLAALGSIAVIMVLFRSEGPLDFSINSFITCDKSYFKIFNDTGINPVFWFLPRVWFYLCAFALGFSFLVWVPRKKNIFTHYGTRTLAVYILHRYLYLAYRGFEWYTFDWFKYEWFGWKNILTLRLLMMVVAFIITVVLSTYPCYWPFEMLGKIKITKLLKKPKEKTSGN
ncbi:MAG: acyltransferase family protein [Clostridia bacterium]|nr:acyltransferase family protein [Clostridia bacterium]